MKDNWEKELRDRLADFEMQPPDGLWEELSGKLDRGAVSPPSRHTGSRLHRYGRAAVAAVLAAAVGLTWYFLTQMPEFDLPQQTAYSGNTMKEGTDQGTSHHAATENTGHTACATTPTVQPKTISRPEEEGTASTRMDVTRTGGDEAARTADADIRESGMKEEVRDTVRPGMPVIGKDPGETYASVMPPYGPRIYGREYRRGGGVTVGLTASCISSEGAAGEFLMRRPHPGGDPDSNGDETNSAHIPIPLHHRPPVRFNLTLGYELTERIGIETGIAYTRLYSEGNNSMDYDVAVFIESCTQDLHYVGIPLRLRWRGWTWRMMDLYLSAGIMGEKCVHNRTMLTQSFFGETVYSKRADDPQKPFQWTAGFSAGIQVRPWRHIALFAEPGLEYRIPDGSGLSTFYSEHPLGFSLNLGLRFILPR